MEYNYNRQRGVHRYTEDQPVYGDIEQEHHTEQHACIKENQMYKDDEYEGYYQHEGSDNRHLDNRVRERHDPFRKHNSYEIDRRRQPVDYAKNIQSGDISGMDYYRRTNYGGDTYQQQNVNRNFSISKYIDSGYPFTNSLETKASRQVDRGVERVYEYSHNRANIVEHAHVSTQPEHSGRHSLKQSLEGHGVGYEYCHRDEIPMNKRGHTYSQDQGIKKHIKDYQRGQEHDLADLNRGLKLGHEQEDAIMHDWSYKRHQHRKPHINNDKVIRSPQSASFHTSQHMAVNDSFFDENDYAEKKGNRTMFPHKGIDTDNNSFVHNPIHNQRHISSSKKRMGLLSTPPDVKPDITEGPLPVPHDYELDDQVQPPVDTVPVYNREEPVHHSTGLLRTPPDVHHSTGLLATPPVVLPTYISIDTVPEEYIRKPVSHSTGLLQTHPDVLSTNMLADAVPECNIRKPVNHSSGLLPTPHNVHSSHTHNVPEADCNIRGSVSHSSGLLHTPPDVQSRHVSTGLLPTPTVSPEEEENVLSPGLLPTPSSSLTNYQPSPTVDTDVIRKVYPSQGLLPTPTASTPSRPYIDGEIVNVSVYDKNQSKFATNHVTDSSLDTIQVHEESLNKPENESKEIDSVQVTQSGSDIESHNLQNIHIQIQLSKTIKGMQKTMEILKQKIQAKKHVKENEDEHDEESIKLNKKTDLNSSKIVGENEGNVERLLDNPADFSNEIDQELDEKIEDNPDKSKHEVCRTETECEMDENYNNSTNSKFHGKANIDQSVDFSKEARDKKKENFERNQKASQQQAEYRTYREWRLAKERMNKYFHSRSSESDGNEQRNQDSGKSSKVKHSNTNNGTVNNPKMACGPELMKHDTASCKKVCNVNSRTDTNDEKLFQITCAELRQQENAPFDKSQNKFKKVMEIKEQENVPDELSNKKLDEISDSEIIIDSKNLIGKNKISNKDKQINDTIKCKGSELSGRRDSADSLSSHHSKERSSHRHESLTSRDLDSDKSLKHKHLRHEYSENSHIHKKSDKHHHHHHHKKPHSDSNHDKHSSSSRERKHSSSSKESKHCSSSNDGKHSSSSKESKLSSNYKDTKYNLDYKDSKLSSNYTETKHSSSSRHSKPSSSSKERHRHDSKSECKSSHNINDHDSLKDSHYKDIKDFNKTSKFQSQQNLELNIYETSKMNTSVNESKLSKKPTENNCSKDNVFEKLAFEMEEHINNKVKTNSKINLFEKFDVDDRMVDIVGGVSSEFSDKRLKNENENEIPEKKSQTQVQKSKNDIYMKTAFVKLIDIRKNKGKEMENNRKTPIKSRENIFDRMSDEISSGYNSPEPSRLETHKEFASVNSTKASETVKFIGLVSEDSSSDVDPFVKMSMFLNRDEKKFVHKHNMKKSKRVENCFVSDDFASDRVEKSEYDSEFSLHKFSYKHDRKKKEFVKYLKKVNKTLYWKDIRITLPRITLKRLNDSDIKNLKSQLERNSKLEKKDQIEKETFSHLQQKESIDKSKRMDENKSSIMFRRIIPIKYSSTEQSESSDLERIVSHRERRPLIEDSDDNLEGSLGSEDSVNFDIGIESDEGGNTLEQKTNEGENRFDIDLHVDPESKLVNGKKTPEVVLQIEAPVENEAFHISDRKDRDDTIINEPKTKTVQGNDKKEEKSNSEIVKQGKYKMSCSESAGKHIRRRFSDSSSDSSEDENLCEQKSAPKYLKMQSNNLDEKRSDGKTQANDDKIIDKNTSPKDSMRTHARQLHKPHKHIKRTSSIMQMDGNADLIASPPDESSGEEGDVEDNIINIDSDEEFSASQDLFADIPEKLIQMSQKFKQVIRSATATYVNDIKKEDEVINVLSADLNSNLEVNNISSASSDQTIEPEEDNTASSRGKEETVIKDEPDWLKCYTQEPDTIFLSDDDDDMIMSISQPVILLSDDETQSPIADEKPNFIVKQEVLEPDVFGSQETTFDYNFEDYSSAEDWSDNGSDFEPENMFQSLQKQTISDTNKASPGDKLSNITQISEHDKPESTSLQKDKDSSVEKDEFDSSDGPVLSVKEDDFAVASNLDEAILSKDEDKLLRKAATENSRSKNMNFKSETNIVDKDFSSSDDELLSTSAFYLENRYKKNLATIQESQSHGENKENGIANENINPYMEETQVNPNISDEDTSNSVSIIDFHFEQFSDISDIDSKSVNQNTNVRKINKSSNERINDYKTLSDDSDFMLIDPPKDEFEVNTQVSSFLPNKGDSVKDKQQAVYGEQTQVNVSDTDDNEDKTEKTCVDDLYSVQTQPMEPGSSSVSGYLPTKGAGSRQNTLQKHKQSAWNELHEIQIKDNEPGPSNASGTANYNEGGDENLSDESFSGEDPQLQSYILQKQLDNNNLRNKRLTQTLGIEFEAFSDDDIAYHANTEPISSPDNSDSDGSYILTQVKSASKQQQIEIAMSDTSLHNDAYFKATQVVPGSEEEKEDQDLYDMATQHDPVASTDNQGSCDSSIILISETDLDDENYSANNDDYLQATQADSDDKSDDQMNDEDIFNMETQVDGCDQFNSDENSVGSVSLLSVTKDKRLDKVKKQKSWSVDNVYHSSTQAFVGDISREDTVEENLYDASTQKDGEYCAEKTTETMTKTINNCTKELNESVDNDAHIAATEAFEDKKSETEEDDIFNIATQKDVYGKSNLSKKLSNKSRLIDKNAGKYSDKNKALHNIGAQNYFIDKKLGKESNKENTDFDTIEDDAFLIATQAFLEDLNDHQEMDKDDIFNKETQFDVRDTENNNENKNEICTLSKGNEKDNNDITYGESAVVVDDDVYEAATQAYEGNMNELENELSEEDDFSIATQKDMSEFSSKRKNGLVAGEDKQTNKLFKGDDFKSKQFALDFDDENDEAYYMETQYDELPDIIQSNDLEELNLLTEPEDIDATSFSNHNDKVDEKVTDVDPKAVLGTKSILKRPYAENNKEKNVKFDARCESSVAKKPRFMLPERKMITIEPQKLKTTAEKRASGVSTAFELKHLHNAYSKNACIEILDATKSDMWLSKKIQPKDYDKKGPKGEKLKKRKRKEDVGGSLQAKMMAARSQLKERSMYNATHPDSIKRVKIGSTATVTTSELEDVTLPTDSQIIDQGLPLLNSTGLLLKGKKSTPHSSRDPLLETRSGTTSVLSIATTTMSMAITTSVSTSVQSTSVYTSMHSSHSSTEKNPKDINRSKDKNLPSSTSHSEGKVCRDRSTSGDVRQGDQSVSAFDKDKKDGKCDSTSDKSSSHSRSKSEKHRHRSEKGKSSSSKIDKENMKITKDDYRESKHKDKKSTRERSKSGDSGKVREKKDEHKKTDIDNDKHTHMNNDSKKENKTGAHEKHDHKRNSKKERHENGKKQKNEKYTSSKQSEKDLTSKSLMKENRFKQSESVSNKHIPNNSGEIVAPVLTGQREKLEKTMLGHSTASTDVSTPVSSSPSLGVTSSFVTSSSSVSSIGVTPVTTGTTSQSVVNLSASGSSGKFVSRSTSRPVPTVRPSSSSHIESSVLLQKQGSHPAVTCGSKHGASAMVASSRQPLQPLLSDNIYNTFNSVSTLTWDNFLRVILKWSPNWFEERERMEQMDRHVPPPDVTNDLCGHSNHMLFPLIEKYVSYKEYSEKFMLPLLLHETWESCYSTWRERKTRRKNVEHKMMFSHQDQGGDKLFVYTLLGLISERDVGNGVNEGDLVKLTINGDMRLDNQNKKNMDYTMSGFVDRVIYRDFSVDRICGHYKEMGEIRKGIKNCVSVKLNVRVRSRAFTPSDKVIVHLQLVSTIMNTWRQFTGLSCISRSPLCRDLLYPTANMTYCDKAPASVPGTQDRYNESQLKAINTAGKIVMLPKEKPRICLLQGPPGTGKSHTIVGIIKQIVKVTNGKCRICLTAPSHAAVDELLRRLIKLNRNMDKNAQIKMVRLGKKSSVHEDIQSLCLHNLVQKNLIQAQKEELLKQLPKSLVEERKTLQNKITAVIRNIESAKDQFQRQKHRSDLKKLEKQREVLESKYILPKPYIDKQHERQAQCNILLKAHVIAGTLSKIGGAELRSAFHNLKGPGFDVVIVDEATQAIELETLIPLQYGVTKLILVGDPEQLPPTVLSQKATENQFNMSLFERLDGHFKGENINPVILLNRQYRMDPDIAAFPNNYIYEGKITNDKCVENRSQRQLVPYLLFNVSEGRELFSQGTRSMSNPLEAVFTAELCKFIITNSSVIEKVIGIIAPYAKQKSEILKELENRHLKNIEVSTVDGFQGREKHVIIMSCVRANQSGTIGFVGDRKRMNVSLTRAKYAMYLVGHFESLEVSDEWKALLADARHRRKIINVDQYSMHDAIKQILQKR